jgi:hypothetical protein
VRRAKTAAEERAIIKKESAYLRTALSQNINKYTKRNMIKLMYMRMLGYPAEFGQVPCLALITKGDYSEKVKLLAAQDTRVHRAQLDDFFMHESNHAGLLEAHSGQPPFVCVTMIEHESKAHRTTSPYDYKDRVQLLR